RLGRSEALDPVDLDAERARRVDARVAIPLDARERLAHRRPHPRRAAAFVGRHDREAARSVVHEEPRALEHRLLGADAIAADPPVLPGDLDLFDLSLRLALRGIAPHLVEHRLRPDRAGARDLHALLQRHAARRARHRLRALGRPHGHAGAGDFDGLAKGERLAAVAQNRAVDEAPVVVFFVFGLFFVDVAVLVVLVIAARAGDRAGTSTRGEEGDGEER